MKIAGVADTQAALWYLFGDSRLSTAAKRFIDDTSLAEKKIAVSAISLAELVYLVEKNRLPAAALDDLNRSLGDAGGVFVEAAFTSPIVQCMRQVARTDVPDLPDRMIATAVHLDVPIVSRDGRIRSAGRKTIW